MASAVAIVIRIAGLAPLSAHLPPTIATYGVPPMRSNAPYLLFLTAARTDLPQYAVVRVLAPGAPTGDLPMNFEIALGQLPEQTVLRSDAPCTSPELVLVYESSPPPGLRPIRRFGGGGLYWRPQC